MEPNGREREREVRLVVDLTSFTSNKAIARQGGHHATLSRFNCNVPKEREGPAKNEKEKNVKKVKVFIFLFILLRNWEKRIFLSNVSWCVVYVVCWTDGWMDLVVLLAVAVSIWPDRILCGVCRAEPAGWPRVRLIGGILNWWTER